MKIAQDGRRAPQKPRRVCILLSAQIPDLPLALQSSVHGQQPREEHLWPQFLTKQSSFALLSHRWARFSLPFLIGHKRQKSACSGANRVLAQTWLGLRTTPGTCACVRGLPSGVPLRQTHSTGPVSGSDCRRFIRKKHPMPNVAATCDRLRRGAAGQQPIQLAFAVPAQRARRLALRGLTSWPHQRPTSLVR